MGNQAVMELTQDGIVCSKCECGLTGGADTYGDPAKPLCLACSLKKAEKRQRECMEFLEERLERLRTDIRLEEDLIEIKQQNLVSLRNRVEAVRTEMLGGAPCEESRRKFGRNE